MTTLTCSEIADDMIPDKGVVVFDWDNTLKIYDKSSRTIFPRVTRDRLIKWKQEKQCDMYIISAIRPSKINLDTILFEVNKLGLLDIFSKESDTIECKPDRYARKGNVVICGYDKAETFLMLRQIQTLPVKTDNPTTPTSPYSADSVCLASSDDEIDGVAEDTPDKNVVFFDDEEPNIVNFSAIVKGSVCYLVT